MPKSTWRTTSGWAQFWVDKVMALTLHFAHTFILCMTTLEETFALMTVLYVLTRVPGPPTGFTTCLGSPASPR